MRVRDPDFPILLRAIVWPALLLLGLSGVVGGYLAYQDRVGLPGFLGVLLAGALLGVLAGLLIYGTSSAAAGGLVRTLTGAGNLPPAPSFSYQEALIMQGKVGEAVEAFRTHLGTNPADHDARLALAALLAGPAARPGEAEREYLTVRSGGASDRHHFVASQALIDLYAAVGQRGKHMAELARFAAKYRGTTAGAAARRVLSEMKQVDSTDPPID